MHFLSSPFFLNPLNLGSERIEVNLSRLCSFDTFAHQACMLSDCSQSPQMWRRLRHRLLLFFFSLQGERKDRDAESKHALSDPPPIRRVSVRSNIRPAFILWTGNVLAQGVLSIGHLLLCTAIPTKHIPLPHDTKSGRYLLYSTTDSQNSNIQFGSFSSLIVNSHTEEINLHSV